MTLPARSGRQQALPRTLDARHLSTCLACSSRRIAREVGVHIRTSYRWCWWLRNAALSYEMQRQLEGTVEADELYHTAGHKGQAQQGGKKALRRCARGRRKKREPGRGHYDGSARDHCLGQSPGGRGHPGDAGFHRQNGAEGSRPRGARGQSALHGLGEQLSRAEGLCTRLCQPDEEGICAR